MTKWYQLSINLRLIQSISPIVAYTLANPVVHFNAYQQALAAATMFPHPFLAFCNPKNVLSRLKSAMYQSPSFQHCQLRTSAARARILHKKDCPQLDSETPRKRRRKRREPNSIQEGPHSISSARATRIPSRAGFMLVRVKTRASKVKKEEEGGRLTSDVIAGRKSEDRGEGKKDGENGNQSGSEELHDWGCSNLRVLVKKTCRYVKGIYCKSFCVRKSLSRLLIMERESSARGNVGEFILLAPKHGLHMNYFLRPILFSWASNA